MVGKLRRTSSQVRAWAASVAPEVGARVVVSGLSRVCCVDLRVPPAGQCWSPEAVASTLAATAFVVSAAGWWSC